MIEIRDARLDDIPTLVALARDAFRDTYRGLDKPEEIEDYVATQLTPEYFAPHVDGAASSLLLAVGAGQLLGYALVTRSAAPPCVRAASPVELSRLYLRADAKGQGLGRSLMQAVQAQARRFGADAIWLGVYDRNTRARAFYQRWGFVDVGTKAFWFGGIAYQDPVMCAPLGRGMT
ncbi:MAG: GNAT family N-acetyltransferase [Burkholderiales bacterium]|nr:GNAT family N-acetyltransferase [Burkholderiales bacterium]